MTMKRAAMMPPAKPITAYARAYQAVANHFSSSRGVALYAFAAAEKPLATVWRQLPRMALLLRHAAASATS